MLVLLTNTHTHARPNTHINSLFANGDPFVDGTILTDDVATPFESAVTSFGFFLFDDVIAATAT